MKSGGAAQRFGASGMGVKVFWVVSGRYPFKGNLYIDRVTWEGLQVSSGVH